jgi:hypothetical protein
MSKWQCSHCFKIYSFEDFRNLDYQWVDDTNDETRKKYGKQAVCICGKSFHKGNWKKRTELLDHVVSTVHLELDHNFDGGDPLWYETMIFKDNGDSLGFQVRYHTKDEAIEGHEITLKLLPKIIENPKKYPTDIFSQLKELFDAQKDNEFSPFRKTRE